MAVPGQVRVAVEGSDPVWVPVRAPVWGPELAVAPVPCIRQRRRSCSSPPRPLPSKAKGTVIVVVDVDSTGRVLDLQFTPTKDGAYNRKLREALVAIRFRPAVNAQGIPVRGKAEITYSL